MAETIDVLEAARRLGLTPDAIHANADQVRMARDVTTMFDELKALVDRYAEMHADRARLQVELEKERAKLERARWRWWHHWKKR
jgi:hypothetical protein